MRSLLVPMEVFSLQLFELTFGLGMSVKFTKNQPRENAALLGGCVG